MWDLSCSTRDQTHVPCVSRQSLNYWTTRKVLTMPLRILNFLNIELFLLTNEAGDVVIFRNINMSLSVHVYLCTALGSGKLTVVCCEHDNDVSCWALFTDHLDGGFHEESGLFICVALVAVIDGQMKQLLFIRMESV